MKVKVIFFDRSSGEGMVKDQAGNVAEIYACNLPGKKTWYANTACVYYTKDSEVEVTQNDNGFIIGVTPGLFDAEKWDRLDHSRLAFRCNEEGKAINGLFANK